MKFEHLRRLVEYLYCGKTKIKASELDDFFLAVKRYKILGLNDSSTESPASSVQCSMVYEFQSDEDDGANDDDKDEHNETGAPGQHAMKQNKRKNDEIQNGSSSHLAVQKSNPNMSKRACTLAQQPKNGNGSQQLSMAGNSSDNRSALNGK